MGERKASTGLTLPTLKGPLTLDAWLGGVTKDVILASEIFRGLIPKLKGRGLNGRSNLAVVHPIYIYENRRDS